MKLFDIQAEYRDIANQLSDGELTPELETALAINQKMLWQKSENYAMIIKEISADEQAISNEIDRLSKMKEQRKKAVEYLKKLVLDAMNLYEIDKIETPVLKISVRKSKATEITDIELIPNEYKVVKMTTQADKTAIKEALGKGIDVPGAVIIENKSLQIK